MYREEIVVDGVIRYIYRDRPSTENPLQTPGVFVTERGEPPSPTRGLRGAFFGGLRAGWPQDGNASPALYDLDGDGRLEVITSEFWSGGLSIYRHDGSSFSSAWPLLPPAETRYQFQPAVGDLDLDGAPELIVVNVSFGTPTRDYVVVVSLDGTILWQADIGRKSATHTHGAPVVANVDQDEELEILVAGAPFNYNPQTDFSLYAFNHDGTAVDGYPKATNAAVRNSPAVTHVDLDDDGEKEALVTVTDDAGGVYAYLDGELLSGWPVDFGWSTGNPSTVLADLDQDGQPEVIAAGFSSGANGAAVYALRLDGSVIPGWPVYNTPSPPGGVANVIYASPAVADLDNDGSPEVLVVSLFNELSVWHSDGQPAAPSILYGGSGGIYENGPSVADLNADGSPEIILTTTGPMLYIVGLAENQLSILDSVSMGGVLHCFAAVGDLDPSDGVANIVVSDDVFSFEDGMQTWDLVPGLTMGERAWPMFQHDEKHTGTNFVPLADVTVTATDALAAEEAFGPGVGDYGVFVIERTETTVPLTVNYILKGTAENGRDYEWLNDSVTFPAGSAQVAVVVKPVDDRLAEGTETVILLLEAGQGYKIGERQDATIKIKDNDPR